MEKTGLFIQRSHLCQGDCLWKEKNKSLSKTPLLQNPVQGHHPKSQVLYLAISSYGKAQRQFIQLAWAESLFFNYFSGLFPKSVAQTVLHH